MTIRRRDFEVIAFPCQSIDDVLNDLIRFFF
ncbi:Uncharacterised protein [Vibrio cholerae]|nr:Uncharacterised protein [Vibrio cholerae]CSI69775.1 Uncharacterised protein [Vibrio cholerae]